MAFVIGVREKKKSRKAVVPKMMVDVLDEEEAWRTRYDRMPAGGTGTETIPAAWQTFVQRRMEERTAAGFVLECSHTVAFHNEDLGSVNNALVFIWRKRG